MPQTLPKKVSEISDSTGVLMHQSITKDHYLRQKNDTEIPIVHETHFFYGFLVWTSVALLILSFVRYSKKFRLWLRALFSLSSARTLEREDFKVVRLPSLAFSILFLISATLFIDQFNLREKLFLQDVSRLMQSLTIFLFLLSFQLLKFFIHSVAGLLTYTQRSTAEYNFNLFLSSQAIGLFLLPLDICILFLNTNVDAFFFLGIIVFGLFFLIQILKGIGIVFGNGGVTFFHVFLYLCFVEFLPLMVIFRIIFN